MLSTSLGMLNISTLAIPANKAQDLHYSFHPSQQRNEILLECEKEVLFFKSCRMPG